METEKTEIKLPVPPFSIYFMKHGEIIPKKWYTVTESNSDTKEIYIAELIRWETFDQRLIKIVSGFHLN